MDYQHQTNTQGHCEPLYMSHISYFNHINLHNIRSTLCLSTNINEFNIRVKISFKSIVYQLPNKIYVISISTSRISTLEFVSVIVMAPIAVNYKNEQLKQIAYLSAMGGGCIIVFVGAIVISLFCCKLSQLMLSQRRSSLLECGDIISSIDYTSDKQTALLHLITTQTTLTALMQALFSGFCDLVREQKLLNDLHGQHGRHINMLLMLTGIFNNHKRCYHRNVLLEIVVAYNHVYFYLALVAACWLSCFFLCFR